MSEPAHTVVPPEQNARRLSCDTRRSQLLAAAISVFARNGFKGTKTREIAAEAGINEALLFRHFPTKDDLYAAILQEKSQQDWVGSLIEALKPYAAKRDDQGYFETFSTRFLDCLNEQPEFVRLMLFSALEKHDLARLFREEHVRRIHQTLTRYIGLRQREGAFREMRPIVAVRALTGMLKHHVMSVEIYEDVHPRIPNREVITAFTSIFVQGMRRGAQEAHE